MARVGWDRGAFPHVMGWCHLWDTRFSVRCLETNSIAVRFLRVGLAVGTGLVSLRWMEGWIRGYRVKKKRVNCAGEGGFAGIASSRVAEGNGPIKGQRGSGNCSALQRRRPKLFFGRRFRGVHAHTRIRLQDGQPRRFQWIFFARIDDTL